MVSALASLLGTAWLLWFAFGMVLALTVAFAYPLMAWLITRNVKGLRQELSRLADAVERLPTRPAHHDGDLDPDIDPSRDVPAYYTRTGPLDIR